MKQKYEFKSVVAETLLIPLYMRAKESRRKKDAILQDEMAEKLVNSIDYDYSKYNGARFSEVGCVIRGWYFDNAIRRFIAAREHPVIVNVGCGLDTRYQRIADAGKAVFYELDLPEVIELRHTLIPEPANDHYIAGSLLKTAWMDKLRDKHPEGEFIFIIEGVLMYFYEKQVRSVLRNIAQRFGGGELWFDVCGTMMTKYGLKPDSLKDHEAQIRSSVNNGHEVEGWEPRLALIEQASYMKFFRSRWGFLLGHVLGRITKLCYRFSSLLGYEIKK